MRNSKAFENVKVVCIALGADKAIFHGLFHSTPGLVAMGAVGESAVVEAQAHLGEEVRKLLFVEVHYTELLDTRGVD